MILHLKIWRTYSLAKDSPASIHSYKYTRAAAAGKFHVIHSQTKQENQSFSRPGARIWNKIPELFKSEPKQLFKKHL